MHKIRVNRRRDWSGNCIVYPIKLFVRPRYSHVTKVGAHGKIETKHTIEN